MRDLVGLTARLPPDLHKRLSKAAEVSGRSLNAELMQRLTDSFIRERRIDEIIAAYLWGAEGIVRERRGLLVKDRADIVYKYPG